MFVHCTSVGLHVHARSVKAAGIDTLTGEVFERTIPPRTKQVVMFVDQSAAACRSVQVIYEAGPTGFRLVRAILAAGQGRDVASYDPRP